MPAKVESGGADFTALLAQVKRVPSCKVCKLAALDEALFRQVHEVYFYRGAGLRQICELLNPIVAERGLKIRPFLPMNLQAHLRGVPSRGRPAHIPVLAHTVAEITRAARQPLAFGHERGAGAAHHAAQAGGVQAQVNLYRAGVGLYDDLVDIHERLRTQVQGKETVDEKTLRNYLSVIRELRGALDGLLKIQSMEKLLTAVTTVAMRQMTFDYLNDLSIQLAALDLDEETLASLREVIGMTLSRHARETVRRVKSGEIQLD